MSKAGRHVFIAGLALALTSCGVPTKGELSEAQCRDANRVDEDGDRLTNCDDPDCWVYDFCGDEAHVMKPPTKDAGASGHDAGRPPIIDSDAAVIFDAGNASVDANVPPPLCGVDGGISCAANETCVLNACVSASPGDPVYVLRIASAFIPDQYAGTLCFDTLGANGGPCSVSPAFLCGNCKPDPYVVTKLNGKIVNTTTVSTDTVAPSWHDPGFEVQLKPDDVLQFTVFDKDNVIPPSDDLIFTCTANVVDFMSLSAIQCHPDKGSDIIPPPPNAKFTITVESSPGPELM